MQLSQRLRCASIVCTCTLSVALSSCSNSSNPITNDSTVDAGSSGMPVDESIDNSDTDANCPIGALYDAEEDVCYIDCDGLTDDQCDDLDIATFGEFDEFIDNEFEGSGLNNANDTEQNDAIARFAVKTDLTLNVIENQQPENDDQFRQIWNSAKALLPQSVLNQSLSEFQISTDGKDETLAFVQTDENQPGKWIIAYDNADYIDGKDAEFIHTTVHEFGHIVFLGVGQVDMNNLGDCQNYSIMEGCSESDSFINQFYQQFWKESFDEHTAAIGPNEDEDAIADFYNQYEDRFVSEYSATNPVEDAAEIFTRFVLSKKPTAGGPVSQQKILFLYQFEALVKLRNTIRAKLNVMR